MEKNLRLIEDKCVVITIGTKKQREETKIQLKTNPIMCGKSEMKQAEKEKWLGQQISARGLAESVAETVAAKEGKIKAACIEVANTALVQPLDSNIKSDRNRLNNLQRWFVRLILQVPQSTPAPALTWETGLIDMRLRIWKEKLMLILHIRSLEGTTLANKIYNKQRKEGWPSLAKETKEICEELNITDVNTTYLTKNEYKSLVDGAIKRKNEERSRRQTKM